mmetsp:Transcript_5805/g.10473  ORF Transcript_5805/g.10473 Transcript_5805/m.10473 type:complete len:273 (+) Transcript_5805:109-927(+)
MTAIIRAAATKPTPSTKLGLGYIVKDNRVTVTAIAEGGLLSSTNLKKGHEIITINGTYVEDLPTNEVGAILASVEKDLVITARPQPFKAGWDTRSVEKEETKTHHVSGTPSKSYKVKVTSINHDMNCSRDTLPEILQSAGVPMYKWQKIYDAISLEMAPATYKSDEMDNLFQKELLGYTGKQMVKGGLVGFGTESNHEKKVYQMTYQCAALTNNANLVATDVSIRANALLAPHGIMCALDLRLTRLPKYTSKQMGQGYDVNKPCGLKFMAVE